ncbi:MAG TPA: DUF177 domain-containing protein [Pyrinomonadaceae bacterium]|nr:DUF177 domain-containing protein [Pyrinomonadaceae bacterium]
MKIEESMLGTEPLRIREEISADGLGLEDETGLAIAGLVFEGTAAKFDRGIRITGTITGSVNGPCARCLEAFERELSISFRSDYIDSEYFDQSAESEIGRDELDADVLPEEPIDTAEIVREQIVLAEPERQVCGPECQGLCGSCGANLNKGECGCRDEAIDPRWEALKKLKKETQDK